MTPVRTKAMTNLTPNKQLFAIITSVGLLSACNSGESEKAVLSLPEPDSKAAVLYMEKCSICHVAPAPAKYPARIWPSILQRMQLRMKSKGVQRLTKEELSVLATYLQNHAKSSRQAD